MDASDRGGPVRVSLPRFRAKIFHGSSDGKRPSNSLIEDLATDLADRSFEVARVGTGWMLRSRSAYAAAIHAAADLSNQTFSLDEFDMAVLAAIAYHQPISRNGLKEIFGKEINRELIGRLSERDLIATGPREPRRGAPYTFVTTDVFLAAFCLESLQELPDREQLVDAGMMTQLDGET